MNTLIQVRVSPPYDPQIVSVDTPFDPVLVSGIILAVIGIVLILLAVKSGRMKP
jgi:hypothetical protein